MVFMPWLVPSRRRTDTLLPSRTPVPTSSRFGVRTANGNYVSKHHWHRVGNERQSRSGRDVLPPGYQRRRRDWCSSSVPRRRRRRSRRFGSTKLDLVGSNYYVDPVSGGSGPALKFNDAPVGNGPIRRLCPGRCRADGNRIRCCLQGRRLQPVLGMEHGQQRQLPIEHCRYRVGNKR